MTGAGCMIFTFEGERRFRNIQDNPYTDLTVCNQNDQVIYQDPPVEQWEKRMEDSGYLVLKE